MNDEKVIPFRPRRRVIFDNELNSFLQMTRNWHPQLREMMFPEHAKREQERPDE